MGWTKRESGSEGYCQVLGDRGNAFGKYQFDRRYGLTPFMEYCYNYNKNRYSKFKAYIEVGVTQGNSIFASIWKNYCQEYAKEFSYSFKKSFLNFSSDNLSYEFTSILSVFKELLLSSSINDIFRFFAVFVSSLFLM